MIYAWLTLYIWWIQHLQVWGTFARIRMITTKWHSIMAWGHIWLPQATDRKQGAHLSCSTHSQLLWPLTDKELETLRHNKWVARCANYWGEGGGIRQGVADKALGPKILLAARRNTEVLLNSGARPFFMIDVWNNFTFRKTFDKTWDI